MDARNYKYLNDKHVPGSPAALSVSLSAELAELIPAGQLRTIMYSAGRRFASERALVDVRTLADFEAHAQAVLSEQNWGWVEVRESQGAVDFVHGCLPIRVWFGEDAMQWAPGFFEGVHAEWMRQLGAGDRLDVREVIEEGQMQELFVFRLANKANFAQAD